jgi:hypothetical protein
MEGRSIPFSAFWLRPSVVSVLISLIFDTRFIEPHDINLIFVGFGFNWQLAARTRELRLGIALPPRQEQPYFPLGRFQICIKWKESEESFEFLDSGIAFLHPQFYI